MADEAVRSIGFRMAIEALPVAPQETRALRELYRQEMNCQIIHDSWHARGWCDSYLLRSDGRVVGYGLTGGVRGERKETVTEFYVLPTHRAAAIRLFREFVAQSGANRIEAQTNDVLLTLMLYDCATNIERHAVLFADGLTTNLPAPGVTFRQASEADRAGVFEHKSEPVGDWVVESAGQVLATGGILFHYNVPYGDIYMEVAEPARRRGLGSYLVQELKRVCYEMGKIPAARCDPGNFASRATLQKAGLLPCARMLSGTISQPAEGINGRG